MNIDHILSPDLRKELLDYQKGLDYKQITRAQELYPGRVADALSSKGIALEGLTDKGLGTIVPSQQAKAGKFVGPAFNVNPDGKTMFGVPQRNIGTYEKDTQYLLERDKESVRPRLAQQSWNDKAKFNPETNAPFADNQEASNYLKKQGLDSTHSATSYSAGGVDRGSVYVKNEDLLGYSNDNINARKNTRSL